MGDKPRYVIDANAIVSAFLFERSKPGRALQLALERGVILLSESVAAELAEVLRREKFERYVIRQKREELLKAFIQEATLVEVAERIDACRDPRDNKYLELAVSGGADCIVSGDEDLLVLNPFRGIAILRPAEFLK
ncbi:putative toxin-antitoxin system toxin component, PIN family [soil metagenome]